MANKICCQYKQYKANSRVGKHWKYDLAGSRYSFDGSELVRFNPFFASLLIIDQLDIFSYSSYDTMAFTDDDQAFVKILKSMGIEEFDPLVPVALNEYAARK